MAKKNFIFLLSLNKDNARIGQAILAKVRQSVDITAAPAFIHSTGVAVFISSDLKAREIWKMVWPLDLKDSDRETFRDAFLMELGKDYAVFPNTKVAAWLNSHSTAEPTQD